MCSSRLMRSALTCLALAAIQPVRAEPPQKVDLAGDPLPQGAVARIGTVRLRHGEAVYSLAYSPDGKTLASAGGTGVAVSLWDRTGKEVRQFRSEKEFFDTVAWSRDGKEVIGAGHGFARRWDPGTGETRGAFGGRSNSRDVYVLSSDGQFLASLPEGEKDAVTVWDTVTGKKVSSFNPGVDNVRGVFSPDGKILAQWGISVKEPCRLWDVSTGKVLRALGERQVPTLTAAFSPDGKVLVQAEQDSKLLRTWDVATGKELDPINSPSVEVESITFSPDGKLMAAGCYPDAVCVWDRATGRLHGTLGDRQRISEVAALALSPDGKTLALGFRRNGVIRLWELETWKEVTPEPGLTSTVAAIAFSPDGKILARNQLDAICFWEPTTGKLLRRFEQPSGWVESMAFSPDGETLVSAERQSGRTPSGFPSLPCTVRSWNAAKGTEHQHFQVRELHADLSPDAHLASFVPQDGNVQVWDVPAGKMLHSLDLHEPNGGLFGVHAAFSGDGKRLGTVGQRAATLWDPVEGKELATLRVSDVFKTVACSPDGTLLAGCEGRMIHLWSGSTGKEVLKLRAADTDTRPLCFSPDGKMLASGGRGKVQLWDVVTGKELVVLEGHRGGVTTLTFSGDGKLLASGSDDTTTLIWDVAAVLQRK